MIYSSTNKVYGGMPDVVCVKGATRYSFRDFPDGIAEDRPLDFHSPYGCSKGAADQYVHDYGRIYGLPTVVFANPAFTASGNSASRTRDGWHGLLSRRCWSGHHDLRRWPASARPVAC